MPNKKRKNTKRNSSKRRIREENELSNFWKAFVIAGLAFVIIYFILAGIY